MFCYISIYQSIPKYAIMQREDFTKKARFTSRRFYYRKIYLILLYFNMFEHKNKPAN